MHRAVRDGAAAGIPAGARSAVARLGEGSALPATTAARFGSVLGGNFSGVRVHDGPDAAAASSALGARAFSLGHHIAFDAGEYRPGTVQGDALLAHELAHVQQHAGTVLASPTARTGSHENMPGIGGADDEAALEADADRAATGAVARLWGAAGRVAHGVLDTSGRLQATRPRLRRCDRRPTPTQSDYLIERLPQNATASNWIYFERNQSTIPSSQTHKIAAIANPSPPASAANPLGLFGYASEDETNRQALAQRRLDVVDVAVRAQSPPGASVPTQVNRHAQTAGRRDYREVRAVEAVRSMGPQPPVSSQPACPPGPAVPVPCTPQQIATLNTAVTQGSQWIQDARDKVAADDAGALALVAQLFNERVSPVPADLKTRIVQVLDQWRTHMGTLNQLAANGQPVKVDCRQCGECEGKSAYNHGVGTTPEVTLCPGISPNAQEATATIVHEAGHGLPPLVGPGAREIRTIDHAYRHSRRVRTLSRAEAERNTDSYVLLIRRLQGHAVSIGPTAADDVSALSAAGANSEQLQAEKTIGWAENHLRQAEQLVTDTYGYVNRSRAQGRWLTGWGHYGMQRVSDRLPGLTRPGPVGSSPGPTMTDQRALAAIADRYETMLRVFTWGRVRVVKGATERWSTGPGGWPGDTVTVSQAWFSLTPRRQLDRFLELLIAATPGISPGLRPGYRALIEDMRRARGVGTP